MIYLRFLVSFLFFLTIHGVLFNSKSFFTKKLTQGLLSIPLIFNPVSFQPSYAIDAFDAATKAMTEKKERVVSSSRDRDSPAAIKRRAVALCKDSDALKAAGYRTSASCTADAVDGKFDKILGASSAASGPSKSGASVSSNGRGGDDEGASISKKEKKLDLSTLSTASKKRRALSACKRAETRKAAKMGSESLCTDRVLKGNFETLIEAMEYGY